MPLLPKVGLLWVRGERARIEIVYIYIYIDIKMVSPMTKEGEGVGGKTPLDHPGEYLGKMVLWGVRNLLSIAVLTRRHLAEILQESSHCVADW